MLPGLALLADEEEEEDDEYRRRTSLAISLSNSTAFGRTSSRQQGQTGFSGSQRFRHSGWKMWLPSQGRAFRSSPWQKSVRQIAQPQCKIMEIHFAY